MAEAKFRFELHLLQFLLHILRNSCFPLSPLMGDPDLVVLLLALPHFVVVQLDVAQVHVPLFIGLVPLVKHVAFLVLLLRVGSYCLSINWVFGTQFVRDILWRLILIRFLRFLAQSSSQIHPRLFWSGLFSCNFCFLPFNWRLFAFDRLSIFRLDFWFFFLRLLVFGRHRVQYSGGFPLFLLTIRGGKVEDVECFDFVLNQSTSGVLVVSMEGPRLLAIGLDDPLNEVEGDVEFLFLLDFVLFWHVVEDISVLLAHLVSDFPLIVALLNQFLLIFEPGRHGLEGGDLIVAGLDLGHVGQHGVYFVVGEHLVGVSDLSLVDSVVVVLQLADQVFVALLVLDEGVVGESHVEWVGLGLCLVHESLEVVS